MRFIFALISFCLLGTFTMAHAQCVGCHDKLTWAPPVLDNPQTITIQSDPTTAQNINLDDDKDYIIDLPDNQIVETKGLHFRGGRNVQVIGGHIKAMVPAEHRIRAALRFSGTVKSVYVEGLLIDTNSQLGLDGLLAGGVMHKPGICADVYIQNTHIKNMVSTYQDRFHADGFQYYGCTENTRMDRVSIRSQYQGVFLSPQHDISSIDMRRVDLDYSDPNNGTGYALFIRNRSNGRRPAVNLENIYVGPRVTTYTSPREEDWERYAIHPPSHRPNGGVRVGNVVTFPDYPEITGEVRLGPLAEPFAPETVVGLNYVSPGYIGVPSQ
ncbi:MAG: hypothetical protein AAF569_04285 [Pseudomonadota bacterium]